jgi:hypothetical protein
MVKPPRAVNKERKGMRLLLISDTRGKLDFINELSAQTKADAVIHAGDFGFYDDESFERLSDRELRLHVTHYDLPRAEKDNLLTLSRIDLIAKSRELRLLGEFQSYTTDGMHFNRRGQGDNYPDTGGNDTKRTVSSCPLKRVQVISNKRSSSS